MRKYAILTVLMAFVIAVTSSCGLIVKDPEVDAQTVVIEVAGQSIVKADVKQAIENVLDYQEYMYSMYGMRFDRTDADSVASAQDTAINALVEEAVTDQKIKEYELDQFTEDELTEINQTVEDTYANIVESVKTNYFTDTELTGEELDAAIDARIIELGYGTKESMLEQQKLTAAQDKLKEQVVKDVTVSESEVEEQYNASVSNAITTYASTPTQYATDVNNGSIVYFQPPGYRYIKNLLVKLSDEEITEMQSLSTQISDTQDSLSAIQASLAELTEEPAEDAKDQQTENDEDQQKNLEDLTAQESALTTELEELTTQMNELTDKAYSAIQPTVDEVTVKIEAGEDFDTLLAEYGEDPGMMNEPQKSTGYLVCEGLTSYITEFVDASMALENVGDISAPFRTYAGVHIVQYAGDLEEGQVPLEDIRSQLMEQMLTTKQDTLYDETISQWISEANPQIHTERLAD